jgi:hypothetical protein
MVFGFARAIEAALSRSFLALPAIVMGLSSASFAEGPSKTPSNS